MFVLTNFQIYWDVRDAMQVLKCGLELFRSEKGANCSLVTNFRKRQLAMLYLCMYIRMLYIYIYVYICVHMYVCNSTQLAMFFCPASTSGVIREMSGCSSLL